MTLRQTPYQDFLYLIRLTLRQEQADFNWTFQTPLSTLFELAKFHSLEALLYAKACEISSGDDDQVTLTDWQMAHDKAVRRNILFDVERKSIEKALAKADIWHLALKGVHLKNDYPQPYMRQMSDNDILFDEGKRKIVKNIMLGRDYKVKLFNGKYDDVYHKDPFYNFEMHIKLSVLPEFRPYFENITDRLLETSQSHLKEMTPEDFYLYLLAHELKHYRQSGTGLRALTDFYYYFPKVEHQLNWEHINSLLDGIDCLTFDRERQSLVKELFGNDLETFQRQLDNPMLERYCTSGTYGTAQQFIETRIQQLKLDSSYRSFVKYYFDKITSNEWLNYCPLANKYRFLIPVFLPIRIIKGLFNHQKQEELIFMIKKFLRK